MGNACLDRYALCGRDSSFVPPNYKDAIYVFDYAVSKQLWSGARGFLAPKGYPLSDLPRWELIHESSHPRAQKLCISGRLLVCCGDIEEAQQRVVFRLCSRSLKVAQVVSGVHFSLTLLAASPGVLLCPCISLVLQNGQEVCLIGDRLGPVPMPLNCFMDFAVVDQGGRNLQMDVILRSMSSTGQVKGTSDWTLRTCLQEYTPFQNCPENCVFLASCKLGEDSSLYLQNLVVSQEAAKERTNQVAPCWAQYPRNCEPHLSTYGTILFEGLDAWQENDLPLTSSSVEQFWLHMVYDLVHGPASPEKMQGEFWISRQPMALQPVYLHCKMTLAQSLVSCISVRFSCQMDYLKILQNTPKTLQHAQIPSRGVVVGVEQDPRNKNLIRMFIEYRNEIIEDMVLCEVAPCDVDTIMVHQEVYDAMDVLYFRVSLPKGQSSLLTLKTRRLEEIDNQPARLMQIFEEPSWRFPIAPLASRMATTPGSRLFLYTGIPFQAECPEREHSPGQTDRSSAEAYPHAWRRPLVESVVVISGMADTLFWP
ncbi:unnamed protein product [Effrenium voratum]|nr:unnamed protein product [Effrenium voratum]